VTEFRGRFQRKGGNESYPVGITIWAGIIAVIGLSVDRINHVLRRFGRKDRGDNLPVGIVIWAVVIAAVGLTVCWINHDPQAGIRRELSERGYTDVHVGDRRWFSLCGKHSAGYSFDATGAGGRKIKDGTVCVTWVGYSVRE